MGLLKDGDIGMASRVDILLNHNAFREQDGNRGEAPSTELERVFE
jgi:hypothetical protein